MLKSEERAMHEAINSIWFHLSLRNFWHRFYDGLRSGCISDLIFFVLVYFVMFAYE